MTWWILAILAFSCGISLWLRIKYQRKNITEVANQSSPLSLAIQGLITTAGGIYLALIGLTSFLKLDIPDKVTLLQVNLDPLALSSIGAAIVQPIILRIYNKVLSR